MILSDHPTRLRSFAPDEVLRPGVESRQLRVVRISSAAFCRERVIGDLDPVSNGREKCTVPFTINAVLNMRVSFDWIAFVVAAFLCTATDGSRIPLVGATNVGKSVRGCARRQFSSVIATRSA